MAGDERCKRQEQHVCDETMFETDSVNQGRYDSILKYCWDRLRTTNSNASPSYCTASTPGQQLMTSDRSVEVAGLLSTSEMD